MAFKKKKLSIGRKDSVSLTLKEIKNKKSVGGKPSVSLALKQIRDQADQEDGGGAGLS